MSDIHLYKRPPAYLGSEPFEGDMFERQALSKRLTGYIDRLKDGCVIGIDAPWGEGKSWFGRNWHAQLLKDGYPTIYLDAFENDFSDDPFVVIASELVAIADTLKDGVAKTALIDKAKLVGKRLLPFTAKVVVSAAGKLILGEGAVDELKDVMKGTTEDIGKAVEKYIESRLEDHELSRKSVQGYRDVLTEFSSKHDKRLVFFIDELDRCKPTFAVQVIERIKHFFDVPNLIFVLLLNRAQLESAIKGVYGESVNANAYLGKFVHFSLTLPKKVGTETGSQDYNRTYLRKLFERHDYKDAQPIQDFVDTMAHFARWLRLSFRDLERSVTVFGLAQPVATKSPYVAYLIALKIGRPEIYTLLARGSKDGHKAALAILNHPEVEAHEWIVPLLKALHDAHLRNFIDLDKDAQELLDGIRHDLGGVAPKNLIKWIINKIDIQISN
jgi:hypothetical protein